MVMLRKEFCVEEEEIGDKLKEIWEMYGDNAESMQLTVVGLLRPRILVDIVEIEDQSHLKLMFEKVVVVMNKKAKDMFDELHEYCTDNEYQIIEVYFQDGEAVLLDNFSQTRFVAIYEDGYWE